jgi:hypothetical protein
MKKLIGMVVDERDERIPAVARQALKAIVNQIEDIRRGIAYLEMQLVA